jgi:mannose-1-phosphate guanylyltransferase
MTSITPVILCGGSGTRLWPLSRKSFPKQFVPVIFSPTKVKTFLSDPSKAKAKLG